MWLIIGCTKQSYEEKYSIIKTDSIECELRPSTRPLYYVNDSTYLDTYKEIRDYEKSRGTIKFDSIVLPKKPNIIH